MANRFVLNTISYHGSGAIKEIPGELQRRGYKKVFVCSDPDLVKFGVTAKVIHDHYRLSYKQIGIFTGPSHAEEVSRGKLSYLTSWRGCRSGSDCQNNSRIYRCRSGESSE